jgi:hypothetical protein
MRRFVHRATRAAAEPQGSTLNQVIAAAVDAANARMRAFGRTEWNDEDYAVSVKVFRRFAARLPAPYPEIAARLALGNG